MAPTLPLPPPIPPPPHQIERRRDVTAAEVQRHLPPIASAHLMRAGPTRRLCVSECVRVILAASGVSEFSFFPSHQTRHNCFIPHSPRAPIPDAERNRRGGGLVGKEDEREKKKRKGALGESFEDAASLSPPLRGPPTSPFRLSMSCVDQVAAAAAAVASAAVTASGHGARVGSATWAYCIRFVATSSVRSA